MEFVVEATAIAKTAILDNIARLLQIYAQTKTVVTTEFVRTVFASVKTDTRAKIVKQHPRVAILFVEL